MAAKATDGRGEAEIPMVVAAATVRRGYNVIHRLVLCGEIDGRQDERGRWLVKRESLTRWSNQQARIERAIAGRKTPGNRSGQAA
jgi:hypothetical protein